MTRVKVALPTTIDAVRARRIERALKSKMKLLHQSGPNSFIVQVEWSSNVYRTMYYINVYQHYSLCIESLFLNLNAQIETLSCAI